MNAKEESGRSIAPSRTAHRTVPRYTAHLSRYVKAGEPIAMDQARSSRAATGLQGGRRPRSLTPDRIYCREEAPGARTLLRKSHGGQKGNISVGPVGQTSLHLGACPELWRRQTSGHPHVRQSISYYIRQTFVYSMLMVSFLIQNATWHVLLCLNQ